MTYSVIPNKEQLTLLIRVKEMPGIRNFPINLLAKLQDVPQEEALALNKLCMQTNTPIFEWEPPLNADAVRAAKKEDHVEDQPSSASQDISGTGKSATSGGHAEEG